MQPYDQTTEFAGELIFRLKNVSAEKKAGSSALQFVGNSSRFIEYHQQSLDKVKK